jgi:tRNA(Ile)-lysidine synthase
MDVASGITDLRACAEARIAGEAALDRLVARSVMLHPAGFAVLDPAALASGPDLAERLLSRLAGCIGGSPYPARRARLARLRAALVDHPDRGRTLGGCRFVPWRGRVLVLRELAAAAPPVVLEPGADLCWDRRFGVSLPPTAVAPLTVGYLGQCTAAAPAGGFGRALPPLVHHALPAFWDRVGVAAVPHLGYRRAGSQAFATVSFRPAKRLTLPVFTVV